MTARSEGPEPTRFLVLAAGLVVCIALTFYLGLTYGTRLGEPRGFDLVAVDNIDVPRPPLDANGIAARPRHTAFVLVDGLGAAPARGMASLARMAREGQCLTTDVGPIPLSRPVYAAISTGVEQDRTGVRLNAHSFPCPAESVWRVARGQGLDVTGISDVAWWTELFPKGFDDFAIVPEAENYFGPSQLLRLGDLTLFHPDYVDEAGHMHGAVSPEYGAAVARADRELSMLLDGVDLHRDLVVVTADHGHAPWGGHGGRTNDIEHVITCFAGRGVRHVDDGVSATMLSRTIGPALSALLAIPFPRHMRAGDDDLDVVFRLLDPAVYGDAYLADRRAVIARFRRVNEEHLVAMARTPSWNAFYSRTASRRAMVGGLALVVVLAFVVRALWRRPRRNARVAAVFATFEIGGAVALWLLIRHTFDFTSTNGESEFIRVAALLSVLAVAMAAALHGAVCRDLARYTYDQTIVAGVVLGVELTHVVAFGWPVGPPVPHPVLFFLPYPAAIFGAAALAAALIACLLSWGAARRRRRLSPA